MTGFAAIRMKGVRWMCAVLLAASVVAGCAGAGEEKKKYSSPEEVMNAFAAFLRDGDAEGALGLFDSTERNEKYSFSKMVARTRALPPTEMAPTEYGMFKVLNREYVEGRAAGQIRILIYSLLLPEKYSAILDAKPHVFEKEATEEDMEKEAGEYAALLNPNRLKELKVEGVFLAEPEMQGSPRYRQIVERNNAIFGREDQKDYIVVYSLGGSYYKGGAFLTQYGGDWRINVLCSFFGEIPPTGAAEKITAEEFERLKQARR